ncbi:PAS domain-containing protein [Palleronia pelagia]|uniref:PAS domain S-box-containing protein n=1 Tax=Palleronia pelagia TaxID=387096 RepID=A0A1H8MGY7_9RHOB|nr:PAS domain-containing protein [Palleronia pelagia]SEO16672.1 PAS domain S-box-containing protein [Palleronia pelagia]
MSAAEVSRNFAKAQSAAEKGPVAITHHGRERYAVLTWEDYEKLRGAAGDAHDRAIEAAHRKFMLVLDTVSEGYVSLDRDWRFNTINRAASLYFGVPREDLIGRVWTDAFPVVAGSDAERMLHRAASSGEAVDFVWSSGLFPGRRVAVKAFPLPRPEGGVAALFTNLAEQERQEEALRSASGRLAAIEGELPEWAMLTFNMDGTITSWNPAAKSLLGWAEAKVVGQSIETLYTDSDIASGAPWAEIAKAVGTGRSEIETEHLKDDGSIVRCRNIVIPMDGASGSFVKILRRL